MTSARDLLAQAGIARRDAELLLLHLLERDRSWLFAHGDEALPESTLSAFHELAARRADGEPIAYIVGEREFWSLPLRVSPAVLIPRPDTEILVQWALELIRDEGFHACLDLGTGSGAIALAIKHDCATCTVTAVDQSDAALAVARDNGHCLGLEIEWLRSDWFTALEGRRWPLLVSNPPYIRADDEHLGQGDLPAEPHTALVSGTDGLDSIRELILGAPAHLLPGGWLIMEHGWDQADAVTGLLRDAGFTAVTSRQDLAGHWRTTGGRSS